MENVLAGQRNCDIFDAIFSENESIVSGGVDLPSKKISKRKTLSSQVCYISTISSGNLLVDDELCDKKTFEIAQALAKAVDKNCVSEIKYLKNIWANTEEFAKAKAFLNRKCKIVWDVFDNKTQKMKIPYEAMKTLGITNKPSLEFLLDNSLKFYEKDNGETTANIIDSILKNPNIDYSFDEIFDYLKTKHQKEKCKYNFVTAKYMAKMLDYKEMELALIGVEKNLINKVFKSLSLREKLHFICCKMNLCR